MYCLPLEQITVTPASSSLYTITSLFGDQTTSCLCASERKTFSWSMTPSALGEGQALEQMLEGISVKQPRAPFPTTSPLNH